MVPKKTHGDWRLCGAYGALNHIAIPYHYFVPYIQDFSTFLYGAPLNIPVHPDDIPKIAITTPYGLFEFLHMLTKYCTDISKIH